MAVSFIAAAPGGIGNMTLGALKRLSECDCIISDTDISDEISAVVRDDCEIIVGADDPVSAAIEKESLEIVRLISLSVGFAAETARLNSAKIPYELIPQPSATDCLLAAAGFSAESEGRSYIDIRGTASVLPSLSEGTFIISMCATQLSDIVSSLSQRGISGDTFCAVISEDGRKSIKGTLNDISGIFAESGISGKIILSAGIEDTSPTAKPPLDGIKVGICANAPFSSKLSAILKRLGAETIQSCLIDNILLNDTVTDIILKELEKSQWLILTNGGCVKLLFSELQKRCFDWRNMGNLKICAVGAGTAAALSKFNLYPDLIPESSRTDRIIASLMPQLSAGDRICLPCSLDKGDTISEMLRESGFECTDIPFYDTTAVSFDFSAADYLVFSNAFGVRCFLSNSESVPVTAKCSAVAVGSAAASLLSKAGIEKILPAPSPSPEGAADAVIGDSSSREE